MSVAVNDQALVAALKGQRAVVELVEPTGEPLGRFLTEEEYTRLTILAELPKRTPEEAARERARVWAEVEAGRCMPHAEAVAEAKRRAGLSGGA